MGKLRPIAAAIALAAVAAVPAGAQADPAVCTWGGTATARTGVFTLTPGLRNVPTTTPVALEATGELGGTDARCTGTMTLRGTVHAGSSCVLFYDDGVVEGMPGVATFAGGGGAYGHGVLFDADGNVVGEYDALARSNDQVPFTESCASEQGLSQGTFAAVIGLKLV